MKLHLLRLSLLTSLIGLFTMTSVWSAIPSTSTRQSSTTNEQQKLNTQKSPGQKKAIKDEKRQVKKAKTSKKRSPS